MSQENPKVDVSFEAAKPGLFRRVLMAVWWVVAGVLKLSLLLFHSLWWIFGWLLGVRSKSSQIMITSYPSFVLAWPLVFLGFFFWWIEGYGWITGELEGSIYTITMLVVIVALGVDIGFYSLIFILVSLVAISKVSGNDFFREFGNMFLTLSKHYSVEWGLAMSIILGIVYVCMFIKAKLMAKWEIANNLFEWKKFLKSTAAIPRAGRVVYYDYPDILAFIIFAGCGDMTVVYQGKAYHITNVPFLFFRRWLWIERILESTRTTTDEESVAAEMASHHDGPVDHGVHADEADQHVVQ